MDPTAYHELSAIDQNTSEAADLLRDLIARVEENNDLLRDIKDELAKSNNQEDF